MSRSVFRATTALGLCLAMVPLSVSAQSSGVDPEAGAWFVPSVRACVVTLDPEACAEVGTEMTHCAEDFAPAGCAALFEDPDAIFADPARQEQAQALLARASAAMVQMDPAEAQPDAAGNDLADTETDTELEALLREALEAQERAAEQAPDSADEMPFQDAEPVLPQVGDAPDEAHDPEYGTDPEADAQAQRQAGAEAAEAEAEAERLLREALAAEEQAEAEAAEAADEAAATEAAARAAEERAAEERALEEARARLRAEAERLAEEEPELVIEAAPAEEFVAPADPERVLDSEQQSAITRLMEAPDVAAAVSLLGAMVNTAPTDDEAQDGLGAGVAAALSVLRRDRGDDMAERPAPADRAAESAAPAEVIEDAVTAGEVRTSREDFESRLALDFDPAQLRSDGRRDLERAGLAALAALAVGMMVSNNRVVARSDERVVVMRDDGEYAVWRDDDVILRQEGTQRRIERFADGSTLTRWDRDDGSQIITIRDATGRVLWRERVLPDGSSVPLVDDMRDVAAIDVSVLPPPRRRELRISQRTDPELALALLREAEADARALDRAFTLRQIREIREVRELVPVLSPDPITFETNRARVRPEEAPKLAQVGRLMERLIAENPGELFLVEGHTDATGPASFNLALSDRRAESVALALTEFFDIPPENLIIQGYGERYLRIPTAAAEERNRRVAIRRISPLLGLWHP